MSRLTPLQLLLANLRGDFQEGQREFKSKEEAYARLKKLTGKDFGIDVSRWERWIENNPQVAVDDDSARFAERLFPPNEDKL